MTTDLDLTTLSASALAEAIRTKRVSSQEAVEAAIARIETVNPHLNAVVHMRAETAREQALAADLALAQGDIKTPLHGVPMTLKDSIDTQDMITTGGTQGRKAFIPQQDATVAKRLREAGAILLGKTNTPELTLSYETENLVYGRTNNPYDPSRTPGGSSGGAAAIVAAGGVPFDVGSDTGGSIRQPAHFCGLAGLKPTSGRVPRTGHIISYEMGALDALTQLGPMARAVDDLGLILSLIAGPDGRDPAIIPMPVKDPRRVDLKALRVAFYLDNGVVSPTAETVETTLAATEILADAGVAVTEDKPREVETTNDLWLKLSVADGGAWIRRLLEAAGTTEPHPILPNRFFGHQAISTAEFTALLTEADRVRSAMTVWLQNYDVIICPVNAYPAMSHEETADKVNGYTYTRIYNLTGWPVAVVRGGTSPEGMPIGIQVVAHPWREDIALAVARHLEQALGGWQPPSAMMV